NLMLLCELNRLELFILIDEYDHFANTILATYGSKNYESLTHGEGFFKAFFSVLKGGATGSGAPVSRLFITGVSPVTMDDVTSGFNIGKNISTDPDFNEMLGFTRTEVSGLIEYYRMNGLVELPVEDLIDVMEPWYGNYCFSEESGSSVFNSDMVLYFMDYFLRKKSFPRNFVDRNVRIDYGKLKHLIIIDREGERKANGNFS
ncbi:MAG: AAA family ATPase, partial [bacterium]|nr:AAA family ATPase [bacterium]